MLSSELTFDVFIDESVPPSFLSDSRRIYQLLRAFINFSHFYTKRGFIRVIFSCEEREMPDSLEPKTYLVIEVEDSGAGLT